MCIYIYIYIYIYRYNFNVILITFKNIGLCFFLFVSFQNTIMEDSKFIVKKPIYGELKNK